MSFSSLSSAAIWTIHVYSLHTQAETRIAHTHHRLMIDYDEMIVDYDKK